MKMKKNCQSGLVDLFLFNLLWGDCWIWFANKIKLFDTGKRCTKNYNINVLLLFKFIAHKIKPTTDTQVKVAVKCIKLIKVVLLKITENFSKMYAYFSLLTFFDFVKVKKYVRKIGI